MIKNIFTCLVHFDLNERMKKKNNYEIYAMDVQQLSNLAQLSREFIYLNAPDT